MSRPLKTSPFLHAEIAALLRVRTKLLAAKEYEDRLISAEKLDEVIQSVSIYSKTLQTKEESREPDGCTEEDWEHLAKE